MAVVSVLVSTLAYGVSRHVAASSSRTVLQKEFWFVGAIGSVCAAI